MENDQTSTPRMLTLDNDSLYCLAEFSRGLERRNLRRTSRQLDDGIRQRYTFARILAIKDGNPAGVPSKTRGFKWSSFLHLRSKFDFNGLRLLFVPISPWVDEHGLSGWGDPARICEYRALLDNLSSLKLLFWTSEPDVDILRPVQALEDHPKWKCCDRWRVRDPKREEGSLANIHPRLVVTEWDLAYGPLPTSHEWLQKLTMLSPLEEDTFNMPTGTYPLLRELLIFNPPPGFTEWFKKIDAPLLEDARLFYSGDNRRMYFEKHATGCWLTRTITIGLDSSQESQLFLKIIENQSRGSTSAELVRMHWEGGIDISMFEGFHFLEGGLLKFDNLKELQIGCRDEDALDSWVVFLTEVQFPRLELVQIPRYVGFADTLAKDLLRLPAFSQIDKIDIGDSFHMVFKSRVH